MQSSRLKKLQQFLQTKQMDGSIIHDSTNLLYYTGGKFTAGILVVTLQGAHLILDTRYLNAWKGKKAVQTHNVAQFAWDQIFTKEAALAFDGKITTINELKRFKSFKTKQKISFTNMSAFLTELRITKEMQEIKYMQKAADIAEEAFLFAANLLKTGVEEAYIVQQIELFFLKNYGVKPSFDPIVAFGKNSAVPHHTPSNTKLKKNQIVLFDLGCRFANYCSDTTKMIYFGKPPQKVLDLFHIVFEAKQAAIEKCKEGVTIQELDLACRRILKKHKLEKHFLHSLGHGVGLEIHEQPFLTSQSKKKLPCNSVITIEPGVYIPSLGGIRLEDQIVVQKQKALILSKSQKKPLIIS